MKLESKKLKGVIPCIVHPSKDAVKVFTHDDSTQPYGLCLGCCTDYLEVPGFLKKLKTLAEEKKDVAIASNNGNGTGSDRVDHGKPFLRKNKDRIRNEQP